MPKCTRTKANFFITLQRLATQSIIARFRGKKLGRVITVLLALALGYFAFGRFLPELARVAEIVQETAQ